MCWNWLLDLSVHYLTVYSLHVDWFIYLPILVCKEMFWLYCNAVPCNLIYLLTLLTHSLCLTHSLTQSLTHSLCHSLSHSLTHAFAYLLTFLLPHSLTHSLAGWLACLLAYLLTYLLENLLTYLPTFLHNYSLAHLPTRLLAYYFDSSVYYGLFVCLFFPRSFT